MFIDFHQAAPALNPAVADRARVAYECQARQGAAPDRLIVVDMSLPSSRQRLWAFDLRDAQHPALILRAKVAHGSGSDPRAEGWATRFGNNLDSGMTSLGLYRVAEKFSNVEGRPAFALDGLDAGFNDMARARHVVFHPSSYVQESSYGHPGRSLGCPAVDTSVFSRLDRAGVQGALMWIDGPEPQLGGAPSLSCGIPVEAPAPAVCMAPTWFEKSLEKNPWPLWQAS